MNRQTIEELSRQVPPGGARIFECSDAQRHRERFFRVWQNWDCRPGRLKWHNYPELESAPWFGARGISRIPVSAIAEPELSFAGRAKDVVDFYSTSSDAFFLSGRLVNLIETMDPGSLERLPISIKCRDQDLPFHIAMPSRTLEAVDPNFTTVQIEDECPGDVWLRRIRFPYGVTFRDAELAEIHSFADLDTQGWYWSRELIEAAKDGGIKGLRTVSPQQPSGGDVDRL